MARSSFFTPEEDTQENTRNGKHEAPPPPRPQIEPTIHPLEGLVVGHVVNGNIMMLGSSTFDLASFWAGHNAPRGATGRLIFVSNPPPAAIEAPQRVDHSKCSLSAHDRLAAHKNQKRDSAGFMMCNSNGCPEPIFWCSNSQAYHHVNPNAPGCQLIQGG